jgi:hypothetical protein
MITMGIDLSLTNCGIMVYRHGRDHNTFGEVLYSTTEGYGMSARATVRDRVRRMSRIVEAVIATYESFVPHSVVIEGPSYMSQSRQVELGGMHYTLYYELDKRLGVEPIVMPPTQARKRAIGAGSPPTSFKKGTGRVKQWIKQELHAQVGKENTPDNEHIRDALVLCLAQQGWHL